MKTWSRKAKLTVWIFVLLMATAMLIALSAIPSPTARLAFRRAEQKYMIGPAQIIEVLDFEENRYDHLLIAESEYGYTFFEWVDPKWDDGVLSYQPKGDGATLYCTKYNYKDINYGEGWLPIFAFPDANTAVRAELTLTITQDGETVNYVMETERSGAGYFLFAWERTGVRSMDFWLVQQLITGEYHTYVLSGTATATLALYDSDGELLETYHWAK